MLQWLRQSSPTEQRTFWACLSGWSLDSLDVNMFSLVIPALVASWHVSHAEAGLIGSVTLGASALGGWLGGALADRIGRVRALQVTILWFAIATFASAFTQSFGQLLLVKDLQGLGFGAEWAAGAVLMAEIIRPEHRGKALGAVQSGWAIGWGASVLLYAAMFSLFPADIAWRLMFAFGLLPALLVLYVRRGIPEPVRARSAFPQPSVGEALFGIFRPETLRTTLVGILFGFGAHGGYYGLFTWLPTFLKTERHLSVVGTGSYLGVIIVAYWFGCITAGQLLDRLGRRRTVSLFAVGCVAITIIYLLLPIGPTTMLLLGFPLGFCAAGIPASMGTLFGCSLLIAARTADLHSKAKEAALAFVDTVLDANADFARSLADQMSFLLDRTGYRAMLRDSRADEAEGRLENLQELLQLAGAFHNAEALLEHGALSGQGAERDDTEDGQVKLMTLHKGKGLEFDHVFLPAWETGLFPADYSDMGEERRLAYVALTRGRLRVTVSYCAFRRGFIKASCFIDDLPAENVVHGWLRMPQDGDTAMGSSPTGRRRQPRL